MLRKKASVKRKIQTEAEKATEAKGGLIVKYPAEGKAGKDPKNLKKGQTSSTEFSYELSFIRLGSGR